ncbi:hypothetical protein JTB14_023856 [Gonioctena quinquepunctata]|nr:hypothetical protein JTB14_023856 [Gonioctena quinquepunctata]
MALLGYRDTPSENNFNPAEMLYGRSYRDNSPCTGHATPSITVAKAKENDRSRYKRNYHARRGAENLNELVCPIIIVKFISLLKEASAMKNCAELKGANSSIANDTPYVDRYINKTLVTLLKSAHLQIPNAKMKCPNFSIDGKAFTVSDLQLLEE